MTAISFLKVLRRISFDSIRVRRLACVGLVLWGFLPRAGAQYVTWKFAGKIISSTQGGFQPGVNCSWSFTFDPTRLATTPSGLYFPTVGYLFSAGNYGASGSSLGSGVLVANDQPAAGGGSFDGIVFSPLDQSSGFPSGTLFDGSAYGVTLANYSAGPTATPFTGTGFPGTLNLNQFSQRDMTMYFQGGGEIIGSVDAFYVNGTLASQVPEPGTLGLLGLGSMVAALGCSVRRR
jgi:hypothetical protein